MFAFLLAIAASRQRTRHSKRAVSNGCTGTCVADIGANVRSQPSTSSTILCAIPYHEQVEVTGRNGNWWGVKARGLNGFIYGPLLTVPGTVNSDIGLNIRSGAGTGYSIVGTLSDGASITIIDISGDWYKISQGYVYAQYVSLSGSPSPTPTSSFRMLDVSVWQGDIDFYKVKAAGISHVMIRSSYGTYNPNQVDRKFTRNIENAIAAGMTIGIYHYGYASCVETAEREADFCLQTIAPYKSHIKFPVAYDIEDASMNVGRETIANMMIAFANKVRAQGYIPWLYSNLNWANNYINMDKINSNGIDFWIAQYNSACTYRGSYAAWQYSSSYRIDGISGNVDVSWVYKNY